MRKLIPVVTSLFLASLLAGPGELKAQSVSESVNVTVVEIPVTVIDKQGKPVRGLTRDNFEITDDGRKRAITYFDVTDVAQISREQSSKPVPSNASARRNFVLLFDLSHSTPSALLRSRDAAKQFLKTGIEGFDLASVAIFTVEKGLRFLTGFTTDRTLLTAAVETLGHPKFFRTVDPLRLSHSFTPEDPATNAKGSERNTSARDADYQEHLRELSQGATRSDDEYRRGRVDQQLARFGEAARLLDAVRGRKQVILLSEGFDAKLIHGRERISSAEAQAESTAIESGELWKVDNDKRFGSSTSASRLSEMATLFKRSDVVLHSIDIQGLRASGDARSGQTENSNESLHLLSNATGGQVFDHSNRIGENFRKVLEQQEVVYVLGFHGATTGAGKFHSVKVKLRNVPGGRLSHRAGYYEPGGQSPVAEGLSAASILMNDIPQDDVKIDLLATAFPAGTERSQVPVVVEIPGATFLEGVKGTTANADIFIYAFDSQQTVRDFSYQKVGFDLTKVGAKVKDPGIKVYATLRLEPGDYTLKTLVQVHESRRNGLHRAALRVPDFTKPTLLVPFAMERESPWLMVKTAPREPLSAEYPFTLSSEGFVPHSALKVRNGGSYEVALFSYNIVAEGMKLAVKSRSSTGEVKPAPVALVGRAPAAAGQSRLLFSFKPVGLAPGTYMLDFHVTPKDAASEISSLPFTVLP